MEKASPLYPSLISRFTFSLSPPAKPTQSPSLPSILTFEFCLFTFPPSPHYICSMKKITCPQALWLTLLSCIVFSISAQAQETDENSGYGIVRADNLKKNDSLYVLADTAYIRNAPSTKGQKIYQVTAGTLVSFQEAADNQKISGYIAPWVKVTFQNNGTPREGYIWRGLLALGSFKTKSNRFMYGIDHVIAAEANSGVSAIIARVKALDSTGKVITSQTWELSSNEETNFTEGKVLGNMGLDSLRNIVRIEFSGDACAIPDDYYYFGFTGTAFLPLPSRTDISDAGAFYHNESILFPSEQGSQPGKIIKKMETGEDTEKTDKKGEPIYKKKYEQEIYNWDGRKAVKI